MTNDYTPKKYVDTYEERDFLSICERIIVGRRDFRYITTDEQIAIVRTQLRSKNIVAKKGKHNTVMFLHVSKGIKRPYDGPSSRIIYNIAVDMKIVSHDLLAVAETRY